jgi:hypothetical protein
LYGAGAKARTGEAIITIQIQGATPRNEGGEKIRSQPSKTKIGIHEAN